MQTLKIKRTLLLTLLLLLSLGCSLASVEKSRECELQCVNCERVEMICRDVHEQDKIK